MKHASVQNLKEAIQKEGNDPSVDFINVCTPAEYAAEHIPGVRSVPLDELTEHLDEFKDKKTIYIHCRSGGRSMRAAAALEANGIAADIINVEGGLMAWGGAGYPTGSHS